MSKLTDRLEMTLIDLNSVDWAVKHQINKTCCFQIPCFVVYFSLGGSVVTRAVSDAKKPFIYFDWRLYYVKAPKTIKRPEKSKVRPMGDTCSNVAQLIRC